MVKPIRSTFVIDGTPDNATSLFQGTAIPPTTLAVDIDDLEDEEIFISDLGNAPAQGIIVIDDEMIAYGERFGTNLCKQLQRGFGGTTIVAHTATTEVEIHPLFYFPEALQATTIALQERVNDLQSEVNALTARVDALEAENASQATLIDDLNTRVTALEGA